MRDLIIYFGWKNEPNKKIEILWEIIVKWLFIQHFWPFLGAVKLMPHSQIILKVHYIIRTQNYIFSSKKNQEQREKS